MPKAGRLSSNDDGEPIIVQLDFDKREDTKTQVCTACWLRQPEEMFTDTGETCQECKDTYGYNE